MNRRTFLSSSAAAALLTFADRKVFAVSDLVSRRPPVADRKFVSMAVEAKIKEITGSLKDRELAWLFENCYPNTLDTTVFTSTRDGKPDSFVITGDIDAMWLRDSTAQVTSYLPLVKDDEKLRTMIRGLIHRQAYSILLEPYANAFMHDPKVIGWETDEPLNKPGVHERKWEVDSLCYAIRLSHQYWKTTGDTSPFDAEWQRAMRLIVDTFKVEQLKDRPSPYRFVRKTVNMFDAAPFSGESYPAKPCGLIRSAFRPSDDSTNLPFLIPSNMFAVVELRHLAEIFRTVKPGDAFAVTCVALADEVEAAIMKFAVAEHDKFGKVFAYEVDGFGNRLFMDDANVPNLLSFPYLGFRPATDPIVQNTRRLVLSDSNPYFASGKAASGIGSPHTGKRSIWHIGLTMQALTASTDAEVAECISAIKRTHAGTGFMHESFNPDDPAKFTRKWFAWANTLFGEMILHVHQSRRPVLDRTF